MSLSAVLPGPVNEPTLMEEMLNELRFLERYLSAEECTCYSRDGKDHGPRCGSWSVLRNTRDLISRAEKAAR